MKRRVHRQMPGGRGLKRLTLLLIAALAAAWGIGFLIFVQDIPRADANTPAPQVDAIVVLTGGSGRLEAGLDLLKAGQAKKMFVSGVYPGVDVAALLERNGTTPRSLDCCIALGYAADDTTGNADETAAWMAKERYRSLLLVTANYHLPRSLLEFRTAMPDTEIAVWPVHPPAVEINRWWRWPGTARLLVSEYNKYLAAILRIWLRSLRSDAMPVWAS